MEKLTLDCSKGEKIKSATKNRDADFLARARAAAAEVAAWPDWKKAGFRVHPPASPQSSSKSGSKKGK